MATFTMQCSMQWWNGTAYAYDGEMNGGIHCAEDGDVRFSGLELTSLAAVPVPSSITWVTGSNPFVLMSFTDANIVLPPLGGRFGLGFD